MISLWASTKQQNWLQLLKILMLFYQPSLVNLRGASHTRELLLASKEHARKMTHPTYPTLNHTVYQRLMGCFSPFQNLLEKSRKNHVYTSLNGEWPEKKKFNLLANLSCHIPLVGKLSFLDYLLNTSVINLNQISISIFFFQIFDTITQEHQGLRRE